LPNLVSLAITHKGSNEDFVTNCSRKEKMKQFLCVGGVYYLVAVDVVVVHALHLIAGGNFCKK